MMPHHHEATLPWHVHNTVAMTTTMDNTHMRTRMDDKHEDEEKW